MKKCFNCRKEFKPTKRSGDLFCGECSRKDLKLTLNVEVSDTGSIPGYNSPGYNEGLGKVIHNKKEWKEEIKKENLIPRG